MTTTSSDEKLRRRKHVAANLALTSAGLGIATLASRGAEGVLRLKKLPHLADQVAGHTHTGLIVGTGIGAGAALNSAAINRAEAKQQARQKKVVIAHRAPRQQMPKVRNTVRGTLRNVSTGRSPDMSGYFYTALPGGRSLTRLDHSVNSINKANPIRAAKHGWRLASLPEGTARDSAKAGKVVETASRKTGAAAHDFAAGFDRTIPRHEDVVAGRTTTGRNAVYPVARTAGHWTRKVVVPTVVLGTSYKAGRAYGAHRQRKKQGVVKSMNGVLVPIITKAYGYDSERDRHTRNGIFAGGAYAGAAGATGLAVHQGMKAKPHIKSHPLPPGKAVKGAATAARGKYWTVGPKGVKGGRNALGATAAAGTLVAVGHAINRKSKKSGDWY